MKSSTFSTGYRDNPTKNFYDIESLNDIFTNIVVTKGRIHVQIVADPIFDQFSSESVEKVLLEREGEEFFDMVVGPDPQVTITRYVSGEEAPKFMLELKRYVDCNCIYPGKRLNKGFHEYYGWNSDFYDSLVLVATLAFLRKGGHAISAEHIKTISDAIINYNGAPWKLMESVAESISDPRFTESDLHKIYGQLRWANGHIDLGKLAKAEEDDGDGSLKKFPPGLKREMSRYGMDIVEDESVRFNSLQEAHIPHPEAELLPDGTYSRYKTLEEKFYDLFRYNLNDVIGTAYVSRNKMLSERGLEVRDIVRELYPHTDARWSTGDRNPPGESADARKYPERDITAANLSALVVVGPEREKPVDKFVVNYAFPVPGTGDMEDLLERMREKENMPDDLYAFFAHFRGKTTRDKKDHWQVIHSQPITKAGQVNIPYYRKDPETGKMVPTDAYIRASTGGAHGGIYAGLSRMSESEISAWTRANAKIPADVVPTIDMENVLHADWSSFYPTLISKTGMFRTPSGKDHYTSMIEHRIKIKKSLPHDKSSWTEADHALNRQQDGLKLGLNSPTGKANTHSRYSWLDLDNATLSMRLMGNMNIWCLGQRLTEAGAFIIATNTDGIYFTNVSIERAQEVIDGYVEDYGMPVDPEYVDRFINRNTSTRIEYTRTKDGNLVRTSIGGELKHANTMTHDDEELGANIQYPLASGHAVLTYMENPNWLTEPYSRESMREIVQKLLEDSKDVEGWFFTYSGTSSRRLVFGGEQMASKINRLVFTTEGRDIRQDTAQEINRAGVSQLIHDKNCDVEAWISDGGYQLANLVEGEYGVGWEVVTYTTNKYGDLIEGAKLYELGFTPTDTLPNLAVKNLSTGQLDKLKVWKHSDKIFGFEGGVRGDLIQSRKDYLDFDLSRIDVDFYVRWAEQILNRWKVTADLPDLGMVSLDDTVIPERSSRKLTKSDWEKLKITNTYSFAYGFDAYDLVEVY